MGPRTGIAWEVRSNAAVEPDWYFSSRGQCASWIRPEWLAQQRRTLPGHVYARLHECRWVDSVGAWLSSEQVEAIFGEFPAGDGPRCIGLDIGVSRDRTALAVVKRIGGLVLVEHLRLFVPSKTTRVDLTEIEEEVEGLAHRYHCPVWLDPYQGIGLGQRLAQRGVQVKEYGFSGDGRRRLFGALLDLIMTGSLRARPHEPLRQELLALEVKEGLSGWRVDHRSSGHDDCVVPVGLAVAGLPAVAVGGILLTGGMLWMERERLEHLSRGAGVIETWEEKSAKLHDARERRPGGARASGGLVI